MVESYWGGVRQRPRTLRSTRRARQRPRDRRDSDTINLGQTFAHEAGHYLGLEHADENDGCTDTDPASPNISDNFIFSSSRRDSAVITGCQINTMRQHGFVRSMTP